jgi:hypothetical protein
MRERVPTRIFIGRGGRLLFPFGIHAHSVTIISSLKCFSASSVCRRLSTPSSLESDSVRVLIGTVVTLNRPLSMTLGEVGS